jgi:hypothetical protein
VAEFRLSVGDIADVQLSVREASHSSIDSVWHNYQEKITHLVTLTINDQYRQLQIETFFSGVLEFHRRIIELIEPENTP